jgi:hypothetical protein
MAQNPLDNADVYIVTLQHRSSEVPHGMEAEVPHPGPLTKGGHEVLAVLLGAFHESPGFTATMSAPEDPGLGFMAAFMPPKKHDREPGGHGYFSWCQVAALFLPGVEHHSFALKVDVIPSQPVDFPHPSRRFLDGHQIVLSIRVCRR